MLQKLSIQIHTILKIFLYEARSKVGEKGPQAGTPEVQQCYMLVRGY